jgi:hypothetical protein
MAQAVSRRPFTETTRVRAQVNPVGFVVEKSETGTGFFSESFSFPCQYFSTVGSAFPKIKKIVLSTFINSLFIHSFIHSPGDEQ